MKAIKYKIWDKKKQCFVDLNKIAIRGDGVPVAPDEFWLEHNLGDLSIQYIDG